MSGAAYCAPSLSSNEAPPVWRPVRSNALVLIFGRLDPLVASQQVISSSSNPSQVINPHDSSRSTRAAGPGRVSPKGWVDEPPVTSANQAYRAGLPLSVLGLTEATTTSCRPSGARRIVGPSR